MGAKRPKSLVVYIYTFLLFCTYNFQKKKVSQIFVDHCSTKKKIKNFQQILKKIPYKRVAQKRYNFASDAANHTFLTHPVYIEYDD